MARLRASASSALFSTNSPPSTILRCRRAWWILNLPRSGSNSRRRVCRTRMRSRRMPERTRNAIAVTQEEVSRALGEEARRHPGYEKKVIEFYRKNPEALANLRAPIFEDKIVDFILEMADVSERTVPIEDLLRGDEDGAAEAAEAASAPAAEAAPKRRPRKKAEAKTEE